MGLQNRAMCLVTAVTVLVATLAGCAVLGPASIKGGRAAYNDAIVATNNQQVLGMMVNIRYGEPSGLLAVSSITANLSIRSRIGAQFGVGAGRNFEGNLVPLSTGVAYEENPTISYTPVQGETYLRQLLSPLPIDLTLLVLGAVNSSPEIMTLLLESINGIRNPDFLVDASVKTDPRFERVVELFATLSRHGHVTWAQEEGERPSFELALSGEGAAYAQRVGELYGLLGLAAPSDLDAVIILPIRLGIGRPTKPALQLRTRSLYDLFSIAAASVEVPEEHLESGLAPKLPPSGAAGRTIRIARSKDRPKGAMISYKRHGWWFFIDPMDTGSKRSFRVLESLVSVRIAESAEGSAAPVLTVPVSR